MASKKGSRKSLGFTELRWECAYCQGVNTGTSKFCANCGASQPGDVKFTQPSKEELITDEARIAEIRATRPDVHCAYCQTRNSAENKFCTQCGADLAEGTAREAGTVVGKHRHEAVPDVTCPACGTANDANNVMCKSCNAPLKQNVGTVAEQTPAKSSNVGKVIMAIIGVIVVGLCLFLVLANRTSESLATVQDVRWERSIPIMALAPVAREAWIDGVPDSAENLACDERVRDIRPEPDPVLPSEEICGTPYTVDQGNGFAEVVTDCEYEIYDDWCEFTLLELQVEKVATESGTGFAAIWPEPLLLDGQELGDREERYEVTFRADGETLRFVTGDSRLYQQLETVDEWILDVNTFGDVTDISPAP